MRIKFLSVIVSFLLVSFAITSCLDNESNTAEYSTDATIRAFAIDTIFGKDYKFTINQIQGKIYNQDSLPVGSDTIIDRILIKTLTTSSGIVTMLDKSGKDSIINIADSIDLRKGLDIKVWSAEGYVLLSQGASELQYKNFVKPYRIEVRVHRQDPDSLNWGTLKDEAPIAANFSEGNITGTPKAVILNNEIFVYSTTAANTVIAYKAATSNGAQWHTAGSISGLPSTVNLSTIIAFRGALYATAEGKVYTSTNGTVWEASAALNQNGYTITKLLASYAPATEQSPIANTTGIAAIVTYQPAGSAEMQTCFAITNENATGWQTDEQGNLGEKVPEGFPQYNVSTTAYTTNTGIQGAVLMGESELTRAEEAPKERTTPWASYDGQSWVDLSSINGFCPKLTRPSIVYYGNEFYAFGNDFATFYTSATGIVWSEAHKKFYFPAALKARAGSNYSMVVDDKNFIWIICSASSSGTDDVWRARLNKLGFLDTVTQ